ncbi:MAG: hypothetical protein M1840_003942 [Geoglossum simile]|nr:MAG: hypothetical protein M1840_003942 [Geoglossum simile]
MDGKPHVMDLHSHFPHRKHQNQNLSRTRTTPQTQSRGSKKHHAHHTKPTADKKVAQSAVSLHPPTSVFPGPSAGTSSAGSQSHSRRGSFTVGEDGGRDTTSGQRVAMAEETTNEAWKARMRREFVYQSPVSIRAQSLELGASITALTKLSSVTSRRLDDTYYLLLEKAAALSSAVAQLRDVANLTARLHQDFRSEAEAVGRGLGSQIDVFKGGFESEQKTIEGLEVRIKNQRVKATKLRERLQEVRRRVKGWERIEGEWQAKTTRRLRILWGVLLSVTILSLALCYWPGHLANSKSPLDRLPTTSNIIATNPTILHPLQPSGESILSIVSHTVQGRAAETLLSSDQQGQHQPHDSCPDAVERTLRLFDEL